MQAEALIKEGKPVEALAALQQAVRAEPADAKKRVFLFQLLAVLGDWERALTQLNVSAEIDASNLLMAQVCRSALSCEALRAEIFQGNRSPLVLGEPQSWVGWMIEALKADATGQAARAKELRETALEAAPAVAGTLNGQPFDWIADADMRMGPLLEAIIDGRYYWVPFPHIYRIAIHEPEDLRDLVWAAAEFTWTNGGTAVGLIPTRYPGSEQSTDAAIRMARKTEWSETSPGVFAGQGQRLLATSADEHPLLQVREILIGEAPPPPAAPSA